MKSLILFLIFGVLSSCSIAKRVSIPTEKHDNEKIRLRVAYFDYNFEKRIDLVFGVDDSVSHKKYVTELHFTIGGDANCKDQTLISSLDFGEHEELILPDSLNELHPSSKAFVKRERLENRVLYHYKQQWQGLNLFFLEKVNIEPSNNTKRIKFNLKSNCEELYDFSLTLSKYRVDNINHLIEKYIELELNNLSIIELQSLGVVFSFNELFNTPQYKIDKVDQTRMLTLLYDDKSRCYIIKDYKDKIVRKIERNP